MNIVGTFVYGTLRFSRLFGHCYNSYYSRDCSSCYDVIRIVMALLLKGWRRWRHMMPSRHGYTVGLSLSALALLARRIGRYAASSYNIGNTQSVAIGCHCH